MQGSHFLNTSLMNTSTNATPSFDELFNPGFIIMTGALCVIACSCFVIATYSCIKAGLKKRDAENNPLLNKNTASFWTECCTNFFYLQKCDNPETQEIYRSAQP